MPATIRAARVPDRSNVRSPIVSVCEPIAPASSGNTVSDRNRPSRDRTVSAPKVRPRNSSVTFSWSRTYPLTHAEPQNAPSTTVMTAARPIPAIAASTSSVAAAAMIDHTNTYSRSTNSTTLLEVAMPMPMPIPNEVTRIPHPESPAPNVRANTVPSASTAPTAVKADTIPSVIDDASEFSRRKRMPSAMSLPTRDRSRRANVVGVGRGMAIRLTSSADRPNVNASSHSARKAGLLESHGSRSEPPDRNANTRPPSGKVAYVTMRPSELALPSWRRGTRFGSEASRDGVHSSEKHSIANDTM